MTTVKMRRADARAWFRAASGSQVRRGRREPGEGCLLDPSTLVRRDGLDWKVARRIDPLHPDGMAPRIVNFAEWARHVLNAMAAELARYPDERLAALHAELSRHVPAADIGPGHLGFAVPLELRTPHGELHLMTTITSFATAIDVTISELKLEAFLPADQATAAALARATEPQPHQPGSEPTGTA